MKEVEVRLIRAVVKLFGTLGRAVLVTDDQQRAGVVTAGTTGGRV